MEIGVNMKEILDSIPDEHKLKLAFYLVQKLEVTPFYTILDFLRRDQGLTLDQLEKYITDRK